MKRKKITAIMLSLVTTLSIFSPLQTNVKASTNYETEKSYIIEAKNTRSCEKIENLLKSNDTDILEEGFLLKANLTSFEAHKLKNDHNVAAVEEDISLEGSDFESEKEESIDLEEQQQIKMQQKLKRKLNRNLHIENQWNIDVINANNEEYCKGKDLVKVAIIDSGVTASENLPVKERINFIEGEDDPDPLYEDISGHGTSVASVIIAKDNGAGITGINPNVELYSLRVLDAQKRAPLSRVVEGIYWCIDHNIDIINMSLGTTKKSSILEKAVQEAENHGILMIAAAGNHGQKSSDTVEYPAAFDEVIAVGASNPQGHVSDLSSIGESVELLAPGEDIPSFDCFDGITGTNGTSMAAPHVTGAASVLLALDNTKSPQFIRSLLKASAKSVDDKYGLIDLNYAIKIYDTFAGNFKESKDSNISIPENNEPVKVYENDEVNALWDVSDHEKAVLSSDATSKNVLYIMKCAQYVADHTDFLTGTNNQDQICFHGYGNYIANYIYLMRIARLCYKKNLDYAIKNAKYAYESNCKSYNVIKDRMKKLNKALPGIFKKYQIEDDNHNRGRFICGLAIHLVMDVYCHRSCELKKGKWVIIENHGPKHNPKNIPSRYSSAKEAACDIIQVWHDAQEPNAYEFYQDTHKPNDFRLNRFYEFLKKADKDTYATDGKWFKARSANDN